LRSGDAGGRNPVPDVRDIRRRYDVGRIAPGLRRPRDREGQRARGGEGQRRHHSVSDLRWTSPTQLGDLPALRAEV